MINTGCYSSLLFHSASNLPVHHLSLRPRLLPPPYPRPPPAGGPGLYFFAVFSGRVCIASFHFHFAFPFFPPKTPNSFAFEPFYDIIIHSMSDIGPVQRGQSAFPPHHTPNLFSSLPMPSGFGPRYILSIMFIATELSTPFVNVRWHLLHVTPPQGSLSVSTTRPMHSKRCLPDVHSKSDVNKPDQAGLLSTLKLVNDVVLVVVFAISRVCALPFQLRMVVKHAGPLGRASASWVMVQCVLSFVVIACLNLWWFGRMLRLLGRQGKMNSKDAE